MQINCKQTKKIMTTFSVPKKIDISDIIAIDYDDRFRVEPETVLSTGDEHAHDFSILDKIEGIERINYGLYILELIAICLLLVVFVYGVFLFRKCIKKGKLNRL